MAERKINIGIVGAGLGGLAAAIGIARAGHQVTIFEQAAALGEVSLEPVAKTNLTNSALTDWRWHPNTTKFFLHP